MEDGSKSIFKVHSVSQMSNWGTWHATTDKKSLCSWTSYSLHNIQ